MMKPSICSLPAILLCLFFSFQPVFSQNLVINPSFELDDDNDGYPDNWGKRDWSAAETNSAYVRSGDVSLKLNQVTDPNWNYLFNMYVPELKAKTQYILRAWVKTENLGDGGWIRMRHTSSPYPPSGYPTTNSVREPNTDWTRLYVGFTTVENNSEPIGGRLDIMAYIPSGSAWIDDVELIEVAPAKLELTASATEILADGRSFANLTARVLDAYDNFLSSASVPVTFSLEGPGELVGPNPVNGSNGIATIVLQSGFESGAAVVSAQSEGLEGSVATISILNNGHAGVPELNLDYTLDVEDWWNNHYFNPESPEYQPAILSPDPALRVDDYGGDITAALEALPQEGGTLIFSDATTYVIPPEGLLIAARNNIHFIAEGNATIVPDENFSGIPRPGHDNDRSEMIAFQRFPGDWHDDNYVKNEALADPIRNFYFKNLTFDGAGRVNTTLSFWTTNDVVFDNCTFTGARTQEIHTGAWCSNFWARGCSFTGAGSVALLWDGTHGSGIINSSFDFDYYPNAIVFLSNDDCSRDVIANGVWDEEEKRLGNYIAVVNNTFGRNGNKNVGAIAASTRNLIAKNNRMEGNGPFFFNLAPRCTQMNQSPDLHYYFYDNRLVGNVVTGAVNNFAAFRAHANNDCIPSTSYSRTGKYQVRGNVVSSVHDTFIQETDGEGNPVEGPNVICGNCISDPDCTPVHYPDCTIPAVTLDELGCYTNSGVTYYLDGENGSDDNNGTIDAPFKTLRYAVENGLTPSSTLLIRGGVYQLNEPLLINSSGVSPLQATILKAAENERVIITGTDKGNGAQAPAIRVKGDYYRFQGIWFGGLWGEGNEFSVSGGGRVDTGREFIGCTFFGFNSIRGGLIEDTYWRKNRFVNNGVGNDPPVVFLSGNHGIGYGQRAVFDQNVFVHGKGYAVNGWHSHHNTVMTRNYVFDVWGGWIGDGRGSEYQGNAVGSDNLIANNLFWNCGQSTPDGVFNGITLIAPRTWAVNNVLVDESRIGLSGNDTYGWTTLDNALISNNAYFNTGFPSAGAGAEGTNNISLTSLEQAGIDEAHINEAVDGLKEAFLQPVSSMIENQFIEDWFEEIRSIKLPDAGPLKANGYPWLHPERIPDCGPDIPSPGNCSADYWNILTRLGLFVWDADGNMHTSLPEGTVTDGSGTTNYRSGKAVNEPLDFKCFIEPDEASWITLSFNEFDTEESGDVLRVYDGSVADGNLVAEFSGGDLPGDVQISSGRAVLHFSTNDNSVTGNGWSISYRSDGITSLETENISQLPQTHRVVGNYPNPFNPQTNIEYELANQANVVVEVYSLLGQKVGRIEHARRGAGRHTAVFNASELPSGVYFYVFTIQSTDAAALTYLYGKMLYLK